MRRPEAVMREQMTPDEVYMGYINGENNRDRPAMERFLHPDMTVTVNGEPQLSDRAADAEATARLLDAFPEYRRSVERMIVSGSTVVAEWSMSGTPAAGTDLADLSVHGCTVAEVRDDRIVSAHLYMKSGVIDQLLGESSD